MSPWRILLFCAVCIHEVCGIEERITGYLGQSVVLKTGADTSWNLTKIQWSIYTNTTYIASLKDGDVTLYPFWTHKGRVKLDTKTGDLTIENVTMQDGMVYTVTLVSSNGSRINTEVHLTVRERLKEPKIQKMLDSLKDGQCHVVLNCTAFHQNVNLSWTPDGEFDGLFISGNAVDSSLVLLTSFSNRSMTFNCTASNGQQTETKQITVGCSEEKREVCSAAHSCGSCTPSVIGAIVITILLILIVACAVINRELKVSSQQYSVAPGI
ncbi:T-lymphocyte surface antigen Ly-9 isoform X2 [Pimephales promelas]|uniref:T-lymphocyte surface antigen Ly-9 isoform X2 n=1 Tax=Pimephales promelas TaxID=90988 RepID=UPI0019556A98|nr:T-lymphocyte surface antigen Ly-9 isoform X2 [Pimephales promelas]